MWISNVISRNATTTTTAVEWMGMRFRSECGYCWCWWLVWWWLRTCTTKRRRRNQIEFGLRARSVVCCWIYLATRCEHGSTNTQTRTHTHSIYGDMNHKCEIVDRCWLDCGIWRTIYECLGGQTNPLAVGLELVNRWMERKDPSKSRVVVWSGWAKCGVWCVVYVCCLLVSLWGELMVLRSLYIMFWYDLWHIGGSALSSPVM